ncbi:MAG: hypothetical protein HDT14_13045 [Oscillibacter sp.]|nr:hypothetical protein [Oscillibacter sp.]
MLSIKARIAALQAVLGAGGDTSFFDMPLEDLDLISRSIVETVQELEALDTADKKDAYCREHDTTPEEIQGLINLFRTGSYDGRPAK